MTFKALELALKLVRSLNPILKILRAHDPDLADQIARARTSGPLNLSEGRRRIGKDRFHYWRVAASSFEEIQTALRTAEAAKYVTMDLVREPLGFCDELLAMTWTMTH